MLKEKLFKLIFLFFDLFLLFGAFSIAWKIRFYDTAYFLKFFEIYSSFLLFIMCIWTLLTFALDLLHVPRTTKRISGSFWNYVFYPQFIFISILFLGIIFFNYDQIPRLFLILFIILEISFLTISKIIRIKIFQYLRISGLDLIHLAFISNSEDIDIMNEWIDNNSNSGFKFKNLELNNIYTSSYKEALNILDILNHGDYLVLYQSHLTSKESISIKEKADNKGVHVYRKISSERYNFLNNRNIRSLTRIGPFNLIELRKIAVKNSANIITKRVFDFIFSLLFISIIYWWVYLIVFFIIKFQSKGPVIFKQERVGLDGEIFNCYKFRTMHLDKSNSKTITSLKDARIFSFGKFMRKTNIDEFPQFVNVLIGSMSVVGPRPHMLSEDSMLESRIEKYKIRRWVKPGITGFAAINGFRGGTESMDLMQKRINLDVRYIEKWSLWFDIKICFDTIFEMIFLKHKGH